MSCTVSFSGDTDLVCRLRAGHCGLAAQMPLGTSGLKHTERSPGLSRMQTISAAQTTVTGASSSPSAPHSASLLCIALHTASTFRRPSRTGDAAGWP